MVQKMLLTLEIDDSALDAAQAKADKLIATLKEVEELSARLSQANKKPPNGGKDNACAASSNVWQAADKWCADNGEDMIARLVIARAIAASAQDKILTEAVDEAIARAAQSTIKPQSCQ